MSSEERSNEKTRTTSAPTKDWRSEAESRLADRRCRCGTLAAETNSRCGWHAPVSAEYARDLAARLAAVERERNDERAQRLEMCAESERVRTELYGTDWTGVDPIAMRDGLRHALRDDSIAVAQYASDREHAAALAHIAAVEADALRSAADAYVDYRGQLRVEWWLRERADKLAASPTPTGPETEQQALEADAMLEPSPSAMLAGIHITRRQVQGPATPEPTKETP